MDKRNLIEIKVIPNSSKNELIKTEKGYRAKITASPVEGKANQALVELLAKHFNVPKSNIEIVHGKAGRKKVVAVY